jgi:hypothetical protein
MYDEKVNTGKPEKIGSASALFSLVNYSGIRHHCKLGTSDFGTAISGRVLLVHLII